MITRFDRMYERDRHPQISSDRYPQAFFHHRVATPFLFFSFQTSWQYCDGNPPKGASNAGGVGRNRDSDPIYGSIACCQRCDRQVLSIRRRRIVASCDSKRRSLLMAGNDDEKFMTRSINVTPKTAERHLTVRSDKSIAYVTNNKRLRSAYCTIEANY